MAKEDRFSLQAGRYLASHHVLVYLEDAVSQLLEYKDENPKVNTTKFFADYFGSVRDGNHITYREFSFVKSTPHNRASFINLFWKCFRQIGKKGDLLTMKEYHSHVCLLCQDFPFDVIQKTARIILIDDAMDCLISFSDFLYAFQVQFYYEEFLSKCADLYKALMTSTPRDTVIVPTQDQPLVRSEEKQTTPATTTVAATGSDLHDGVDSMQFYRALLPICDKHEFSCPPTAALKSILHANARVSFYGFLMALSKNDALIQSIGVLPAKEDIYGGIEEDNILTQMTSRPSTARNSTSDTMATVVNETAVPIAATSSTHSLDKSDLQQQRKTKTKKRIVRRPAAAKIVSTAATSSDTSSSESDSSSDSGT